MADEKIIPDNEIIECWCGAKGVYDELFNDDCLDNGCDGFGFIDCECGGDGICVCHNHGIMECSGCENCEDWDDDDDDDDEE